MKTLNSGACPGRSQKTGDQRGYKIVADISYPFKSTDVKSEVLKIKRPNPTWLPRLPVGDMMLFAKAYKELKVDFNVNLSYWAATMTQLCAELEEGRRVLHGAVHLQPRLHHQEAGPGQINEMYKKRSGVDFDGVTIEGFTSVLVIADAFNRANPWTGSPGAGAPHNGLSYPHPAGGPGEVQRKGQNIMIISNISQVQGGEYRVIWRLRWPQRDGLALRSWDKRK